MDRSSSGGWASHASPDSSRTGDAEIPGGYCATRGKFFHGRSRSALPTEPGTLFRLRGRWAVAVGVAVDVEISRRNAMKRAQLLACVVLVALSGLWAIAAPPARARIVTRTVRMEGFVGAAPEG